VDKRLNHFILYFIEGSIQTKALKYNWGGKELVGRSLNHFIFYFLEGYIQTKA